MQRISGSPPHFHAIFFLLDISTTIIDKHIVEIAIKKTKKK